jgi:IclR family acetate operon transcriptional repressor
MSLTLRSPVGASLSKLTPLVYGRSQYRSQKSEVQVLARAAMVLRSLENRPEGLSLGAIAWRVGLPRSTVQRIVNALESESLVIVATPRGGVRLGPGALRLSARVETTTSDVVRPHMVSLAGEIGETVNLSTMGRHHAVIVEQVCGPSRQSGIAAIAVQLPLHCTANGKAMLAMMDRTEIIRRIGRNYERRTEFTRTTLDELIPEFAVTRRTGVAYSLEENAPGICAVGVAFRDSRDNLMALSVPIASPRFNALKLITGQRLLAIKVMISAEFAGFRQCR